jgi:hypothetical protein
VFGSCTANECRVEDETVLMCQRECRFGKNEHTLGVLPLVLRARKRAFSAPRIWTVEAGYLAKLVKDPLVVREPL